MATNYNMEFKDFLDDCMFLTIFYNEIRYPGEDYEEDTKDDAIKAFEIAKKVRGFVINQVNSRKDDV